MNLAEQAAVRSGQEQAATALPRLCAYCGKAAHLRVWWRWPDEQTPRRTAVCVGCREYPAINGARVIAVEEQR